MIDALPTMARRYLSNSSSSFFGSFFQLTMNLLYVSQARFPFLDEDVIRTLLDIPLWEIADLNQPSGVGDKKILREVFFFSSKFIFSLHCNAKISILLKYTVTEFFI